MTIKIFLTFFVIADASQEPPQRPPQMPPPEKPPEKPPQKSPPTYEPSVYILLRDINIGCPYAYFMEPNNYDCILEPNDAVFSLAFFCI